MIIKNKNPVVRFSTTSILLFPRVAMLYCLFHSVVLDFFDFEMSEHRVSADREYGHGCQCNAEYERHGLVPHCSGSD